MDENRLQYLHQHYINDQMSPEELKEWTNILTIPAAEQSIREVMDVHWQSMSSKENRDFKKERFDEMFREIVGHQKSRRNIWSSWSRHAVAAAAAIVVLSAGLFYFNQHSEKSSQTSVFVNDVAPGKHSATLTLANGQKILINEALSGNIASQSGVKISKTADGQIVYEISDENTGKMAYNTLSTARGEQVHLRLPDGSLVFLNAASSLTYPTSFAKAAARRVSLTGEGYFEVAKDKVHPFVVATAKQEVQVLGTHFNINAYPDESAVATTLLEGSVLVRSIIGTEQTLKPGFQSVNSGTAMKVIEADVDNIVDWKDGDFNLDGLDFKLAMRKIGRWYDVEVIYENGVPGGIETGGWISRNNKLSDVLKLIEKSGFVHFKVEGKKLHVFK